VPVRARAPSFRGQFKAALTNAGLVAHVPPQVWHKAGVVPSDPAGPGPEVLPDRAPDLRRMASTNHRSETLADGHGTFRFQASGRQVWHHLTRPAAECIRRFLPPGLPQGVLKLRDSGFLSPHGRGALAPSRTRLQACPSHDRPAQSGHHRAGQDPPPAPAEALHGRKGGGQLVLLWQLSPHTRGPPCGRRAVTSSTGGRPWCEGARHGGLDQVGPASQDRSGLRTQNPALPAPLSVPPGPIPLGTRAALR
jgi:hypothetical protein